MKEIEVKFLKVDLPDLKKRLKRLGAKRVFPPTLFRAMHFQHPDLGKRYFNLFRLRLEGKELVLATKNVVPGGKFKIEEEREIQIHSDMKAVQKFLEGMGFRVSRELEKFREEYKIGKLKIEIDRYPKMKPYAEIEGPNKKVIRALAEKLGFDFKDASNATATEIIKEAGLNPNKLLFRRR